MARMSPETVVQLRCAVVDPIVVARYWQHVQLAADDQCWLWTGAISGKGHGRFQIADRHVPDSEGRLVRQTFVVIAHRFGYAFRYGVDALLGTPMIAHRCDNPLCQNPACWEPSNHRHNGRDSSRRRDVVRGPLADMRGARGRARAVRDAARSGQSVEQAVLAGLRPVHREQLDLFPVATSQDEQTSLMPAPTSGVSGRVLAHPEAAGPDCL